MKGMDWYAVLGVPRGARDEEIRLAYRELALIHHPDRNPGNAAAAKKFMLVKEAYEALSDPHERLLHDQTLKLAEGKAWAPAKPRVSGPDVPPPSKPERFRGRGLSERQVVSRAIIGAGALLAARGFLGAYVAPRVMALEPLLSLRGGPNEAFLFFLVGLTLVIFGLGR